MTYRHSTADFAGIPVDAYLDDDNNSYITLSSLGAGLGVSRQNTNQWIKRHNKGIEGIPVTVGQFNKAATAYPASVIREFISYRRSLGDKQAEALTDSIVQAAFDRHAKETNLVTVSTAQNEAVTAAIRMELVNRMVKLKRAKVTKANYAVYMADLAESTEVEQEIAAYITLRNDTIKRVDAYMTTIKHTEYETQVNAWDMSGIETYRVKLEALGVSC